MTCQSGPPSPTVAAGRGAGGRGAACQSVAAGDANAFQSEVEGEDGLGAGHALRMAGFRAQAIDVDPEQPPGTGPALLERQLEHHARIHWHRCPGGVAPLALERSEE